MGAKTQEVKSFNRKDREDCANDGKKSETAEFAEDIRGVCGEKAVTAKFATKSQSSQRNSFFA
jgi:hypothetical protein